MTFPGAVWDHSCGQGGGRFALTVNEANLQIFLRHHFHCQWGGKDPVIFLQSRDTFTLNRAKLLSLLQVRDVTWYVESTAETWWGVIVKFRDLWLIFEKCRIIAVRISLPGFQEESFKLQSQSLASPLRSDKDQLKQEQTKCQGRVIWGHFLQRALQPKAVPAQGRSGSRRGGTPTLCTAQAQKSAINTDHSELGLKDGQKSSSTAGDSLLGSPVGLSGQSPARTGFAGVPRAWTDPATLKGWLRILDYPE